MKQIQIWKERARRLKRELVALYFAYGDGRTGFLPKLLVLLTLGYALSPIDLIPDFIPVLGYLDDLLLLPGLIALSIRLIPPAVMEEARRRAEEDPPSLKKNWLFGALILFLWGLLILAVVRAVLR